VTERRKVATERGILSPALSQGEGECSGGNSDGKGKCGDGDYIGCGFTY